MARKLSSKDLFEQEDILLGDRDWETNPFAQIY